ncbi:Piezo-type mechanosensitive ion channel component 2 [Aphelenchoides bicaudatus]|nr:Piezo-type mechanosensitive ion channel component 2 [Aphelenchoides bicaudatus]
MDALASILVCVVLTTVLSNRATVRLLWPLLLIYLIIELPLQYAMELGIPYSFCIQYPWFQLFTLSNDVSENNAKNTNLLEFLQLANYEVPRRSGDIQLIADFFLLMTVLSQWFVFQKESRTHPAGDNESIYKDGDFVFQKDNPHYDYIAEQRSFVDYIKIFVFMYGHWLTLVMILAAGLGGQSLFSLGYLMFAFWILWQGNDLYTIHNFKNTLSKWYIVCSYTVMVILWKISLQLVGCVFTPDIQNNLAENAGCIFRHLFGIVCANPDSFKRLNQLNKETCTCIVEIRCEKIQANRGAALITQLVEKQMTEQNEKLREKFNAIKKRMAAIRQVYEAKQPETNRQTIETYAPSKTGRRLLYLLYTATTKDLDFNSTLEAVESAELIKDEEKRMIEAVCHRRNGSTKVCKPEELEIPTIDGVDLAEQQSSKQSRTPCFVVSYTHVLCYITACIAHAYCGGLITLPLPLMVFLWATLSSPRPPKLFWIIMITYTELIIIVQFVFQFGFWTKDANADAEDSAFKLSHVIGVQKRENFAVWNVALLVCLFLHRYMLRRIGIWNDENIENESSRGNMQSLASFGTLSIETDVDDLSSSEDFIEQEARLKEKRHSGLSLFFHNLLYPTIRYVRDLYPILFFLDLICLSILAVFYSKFGEASSNSNVLTSSRIPVMLVVLIFILILMAITDRALYLRKSVKGKLIYQLFTIVLLHAWMLGILPWVTQIKASENDAARWFYIFKCMYLIVSAWQIRNGYPKLCVGHLLTSSYGIVNYALFKVYMFLPWIFEVRTVVDWTWTETTFSLFDFIKMEMLYARIYLVKCSRVFDESFPSPRGLAKSRITKYLLGIPTIFITILLILSPLLLFSLLNHIGEQTDTQQIDLTVSLEGYPPLYTMSAQGIDVKRGSWGSKTSDHDILIKKFSTGKGSTTKKRVAVSFIRDYFTWDRADFLASRAKFRPDSDTFWPISSQSLVSMKEKLTNVSKSKPDPLVEDNETLLLRLHLKFIRIRVDPNAPFVSHSIDRKIKVNSKMAAEILNAIDHTGKEFEIPHIIPYFLRIPTEGQISDADSLLPVILDKQDRYNYTLTYSNATFQKSIDDKNNQLWTMQFKTGEVEKDHMFDFEQVEYGNNRSLTYIPDVLSSWIESFPPSWLKLQKEGLILGMYAAIVYVIARLVRTLIQTSPLEIIIDELPNPDHVLKICLDIYLVREAREFILEEDLFARLLFLFRSPATLIKWSRPKLD